jgi:hypothetical protein
MPMLRNMTRRALLALLTLTTAAPAAGAEPFANAGLCPADASHFVHVRDAPALRRELAGRPIAGWVAGLLEGDFGLAWRGLAEKAGMSEEALFDLWLGRSSTLMVRRGAT